MRLGLCNSSHLLHCCALRYCRARQPFCAQSDQELLGTLKGQFRKEPGAARHDAWAAPALLEIVPALLFSTAFNGLAFTLLAFGATCQTTVRRRRKALPRHRSRSHRAEPSRCAPLSRPTANGMVATRASLTCATT